MFTNIFIPSRNTPFDKKGVEKESDAQEKLTIYDWFSRQTTAYLWIHNISTKYIKKCIDVILDERRAITSYDKSTGDVLIVYLTSQSMIFLSFSHIHVTVMWRHEDVHVVLNRSTTAPTTRYSRHGHVLFFRATCMLYMYISCTENFYISILSHPTSSILHPASYINILFNPILSYPTKIKVILVETKIQCSPTIILYICPWSFMQHRESVN